MTKQNNKIYFYLSYTSILLMIIFFAGIIIYAAKLGDRNQASDVFVILSALNVIPFIASLMFIAFQYPRIPSKFGVWYQKNLVLGSITIIIAVFLIVYAVIMLTI